jgi:hypothetical protein
MLHAPGTGLAGGLVVDGARWLNNTDGCVRSPRVTRVLVTPHASMSLRDTLFACFATYDIVAPHDPSNTESRLNDQE